MARLDRSTSARQVAQIGATIGQEFHYALLRDLCHLTEDKLQAALADLVASELVLQRGAPPDAVYAFKHVLVQDAAYDSLVSNARRRLHARITDALEADSPGFKDTQPEVLARHYAEAGLAEKSAACWARAGESSATRSMSAEAAAQFQLALDQLALLPDGLDRQRQELAIRAALGAVLHAVKGFAAPETGDNYARARALWEQLGSPSDFLQIPFGQSEHHINRGELDLALRLAQDLLGLSRQRGDTAGLVLGHYASGLNLMATGCLGEARMHLEEGLATYDPAVHGLLVHQAGVHPHVNLRAVLGHVLFCLGYPDQAVAQSHAAIADARRLAHPPSLAASSSLGSRVLSLAGDHSVLDEWASQLVAVATEQGFPRWRALGTIYGGWARVGRGEVSEGISRLSSGLAAFRCTGDAMWMPHYTALLARSYEILVRPMVMTATLIASGVQKISAMQSATIG